jgi:hypothetical protein
MSEGFLNDGQDHFPDVIGKRQFGQGVPEPVQRRVQRPVQRARTDPRFFRTFWGLFASTRDY